jgi:hypothetical protein
VAGWLAEMSPPGGAGGLVRAGFVNCGNVNTTIFAGGAYFKSRFTQPSDAPTMEKFPRDANLNCAVLNSGNLPSLSGADKDSFLSNLLLTKCFASENSVVVNNVKRQSPQLI